MMKSKSSSPSDLDTRHHFLLRTHFGDAFKCYWESGTEGSTPPSVAAALH